MIGGPFYEADPRRHSLARPHRPDCGLLALSGAALRRQSPRHVDARAGLGAELHRRHDAGRHRIHGSRRSPLQEAPASATSSSTAITSPRMKAGCSRSFRAAKSSATRSPCQEPAETIRYLREIAEQHPNPVVCFGDDGEKFGTWPGTKKHVYENGWLTRFLHALSRMPTGSKLCTLGEAVDNVPPVGIDLSARLQLPRNDRMGAPRRTTGRIRISSPSASSTIPSGTPCVPIFAAAPGATSARNIPKPTRCIRECCRSASGCSKLRPKRRPSSGPTSSTQARTELYRGQCNCSYWHGAFGGLYLPHLRHAVYNHLIAADSLLGGGHCGRPARWVQIDADDYNLDARKEIRIAGDRLVAFLAPSRGGHLYELDVRSVRVNLLGTLNRRPEAYHEVVRSAAHSQHDGHSVASIHDAVRFKQPDLDQHARLRQLAAEEPGRPLPAAEHRSGRVSQRRRGIGRLRARRL